MTPKGFTLIEMLVSVAIFSIVMTIALGALLAMSENDRRAQSLKAVINNLSFSIDSMSRAMRTGQIYHCNIGSGTITAPANCESTPASSIALLSADGTYVAYCSSGGAIKRAVSAGAPPTSCSHAAYLPMTSSDVTITRFDVYVQGAALGDGIQPKVTLLIAGEVAVDGLRKTTFNLQTSITQRLYDQ